MPFGLSGFTHCRDDFLHKMFTGDDIKDVANRSYFCH